jgi:hypothetical protein
MVVAIVVIGFLLGASRPPRIPPPTSRHLGDRQPDRGPRRRHRGSTVEAHDRLVASCGLIRIPSINPPRPD